ncbi:MAG: alpha/beta hydrolase [Deltaproteobacteria bacterium]|nr:alpha/beta hydrolase [Deltaproteobacteria bacterium]
MRLALLAALLCAATPAWADEAQMPEQRRTITFPSEDGIPVTADLWADPARDKPFIVLFHQAGWSRGEYRQIAPRLSIMGFNLMAVDLRSGGKVGGVINRTRAAAAKAGKKTDYVSALPDMRAAIAYARKHHARGKVILWGSSYSAGLVLWLGARVKADAVLAFAPGEYFRKLGKPRTWVRTAAAKLTMPVFITSARSEHRSWKAIYAAIPGNNKQSYLPTTRGQHGSRALWNRFPDSAGYWAAVRKFLDSAR